MNLEGLKRYPKDTQMPMKVTKMTSQPKNKSRRKFLIHFTSYLMPQNDLYITHLAINLDAWEASRHQIEMPELGQFWSSLILFFFF